MTQAFYLMIVAGASIVFAVGLDTWLEKTVNKVWSMLTLALTGTFFLVLHNYFNADVGEWWGLFDQAWLATIALLSYGTTIGVALVEAAKWSLQNPQESQTSQLSHT